MNRRPSPPSPRSHPPAYRRAFERLDAALEANTEAEDYSERVNLLGIAMFGDSWKQPASDEAAKPSH